MASSLSRFSTPCLSNWWWNAATRSCCEINGDDQGKLPVARCTMILSPTTPREEILRTCRLLMAAGEIHEVRSPKAGRRGTISGYFDDVERLADSVLPIDGTVSGVYLTLNPCDRALFARATNRLKEHARDTTSDSNILRRL